MNATTKTDACLEAALQLVEQGFKVIPLCNATPDGKCGCGRGHKDREIGKVPLTPHGLKDCTQTQSGVRKLWARYPNANIGLVSDELVVLDFDSGHGGLESKAAIEAKYGPLPRTRTHKTGGGGQHWIYRAPAGVDTRNTTGLAGYAGVDLRANGGYFVAPPSLHPSGNRYEFLDDATIVEAPAWLVTLCTQKRIVPVAQPGGHGEAVISDGQRNDTLARQAGAMRRRGMSSEAIAAALSVVNREQCQPPLAENEVLKIAESIGRYEPATGAVHFNLTDLGNGERFASAYQGHVKYCAERKSWLIWNGKVWKRDTGGRIVALAKKTVREIYHEAGDEPDESLRKAIAGHARRSESQGKIDAMLELAKSETGIPVEVDQLDANQWLLNVNNGIIDLRTGELKPHNPADLITELIPIDYTPTATSQVWDAFLERIFESNQDLITYVQRAFGYSITGDQSEQVFFFCYGRGFNGKSTLLGAVCSVLGNHSTEVPPTTFMVDKNRRGGPDEAIASLYNKRFVCSTELEDSQKLSVSLVKRMTGGEMLRCERKFEHGFNFKPTHKLWLSGNHEPIITDTTNSIWFRLKKIPFTVEIPEDERVKGLAEKLTAKHGTAILTWLVQGCLDWQLYGLGEPETVRQAVAEYREQQDILHDFLTESCLVKSSEVVEQATLYRQYEDWAEENEANPIGKTTFGNRLKEKGIKPSRGTGNKATWQGIRLLTSEEKR